MIPGSGRSSEKGMATHSGIFVWRIPWTEKPGGLQSMVSQSETIEWLAPNMSVLLHSSCCCHILYLKMFLSAIIPILRNLGGERSSIVLNHIFMFVTALLSFLKCQVSLNIISLLTEKLPLTFILEQWFSTGCYFPPKGNIWTHILLL